MNFGPYQTLITTPDDVTQDTFIYLLIWLLLATSTMICFVWTFPAQQRQPPLDLGAIRPLDSRYPQSVPYQLDSLAGDGRPVPPRKWLDEKDIAFLKHNMPSTPIRHFIPTKDEALLLYRAAAPRAPQFYGHQKTLFDERFGVAAKTSKESRESGQGGTPKKKKSKKSAWDQLSAVAKTSSQALLSRNRKPAVDPAAAD
ncbi:unnamed protein product, partial [Mesorhabditis spiculigera]